MTRIPEELDLANRSTASVTCSWRVHENSSRPARVRTDARRVVGPVADRYERSKEVTLVILELLSSRKADVAPMRTRKWACQLA